MRFNYQRISNIAHEHVYQLIKLNKVELTKYTFNDYFQYMIDKYNIRTFSHHFEDNLILGVTMIDESGISISYEKDSIPSRQNFTKCHELGHLVLEHDGSFFAEKAKHHTKQELEADYFSSIILMPDIVLITKIIYQQLSYQQLQEQLQVSNKALAIRLRQFAQTYGNLPYHQAQGLVTSFRANTKAKEKLLKLIRTAEPIIIAKYKAVQPNYIAHLNELLKSNKIATSLELSIITEKEFRQKLPSHFSYAWQFGRGIDFYYVWNNQKVSTKQAQKLAKDIWFKLAY